MTRQRRIDKIALGYAAGQAGDTEAAERLYREAIAEGDSHGYNNLAQILIDKDRLREVERLLRRGIRAGDGLAAKTLILFLLEQGKEPQALKALKEFGHMKRARPTEVELRGARAYGATD